MFDSLFSTSLWTPAQIVKLAKKYEELTFQERINLLTEAMEIEYRRLGEETVGTSVYKKKHKNLSIEYIDDIL